MPASLISPLPALSHFIAVSPYPLIPLSPVLYPLSLFLHLFLQNKYLFLPQMCRSSARIRGFSPGLGVI